MAKKKSLSGHKANFNGGFSETSQNVRIDLSSLLESRQYNKIVEEYSGIKDNASADPEQALILAIAYFKLEKHEDAFRILRSIGREMVNRCEFHSLMGATCRRLGLVKQAKTHFEHGCRLEPNNYDILNNYANLLIDEEEFVEAESTLKKIIENCPNHPDARSNLERLYLLRATHQPKAQCHWEAVDPLAAAFDQQYISSGLKTSVQHRDPSKENTHIKEDLLPKASSEDVALDQMRIVPALIGTGQYESALQLISSAQKLFKLISPEVYLNAADALVRLNRFKQAEIFTLHAMVAGGRNFGAYSNLINFALMRGDCKLAAYYFKQAAEHYPTEERLESLREQIRKTHAQRGRDYYFGSDW